VTITEDTIDFDCRNQKKDSGLLSDMGANMLGPDDPKKNAEISRGYLCLIKNRIDRRTGVWTAVNAGEMLSGQSDSAKCTLAPASRQF
jgi:hypothetical protein